MSIYSDRVLKDSPAIYLRLGEKAGDATAHDLSGNGHDGTYEGGASLGRSGMVPHDKGACVEFDASDDDVMVTKHNDLDPTNGGDFTLEAVFRFNTAGALQYIISNGANSYSLRMDTGDKLELAVDNSATIWCQSTAALVLGKVYHVVAVGSATSGNVKLYVNGEDVTDGAGSQSVSDAADLDFYVGARTGGASFFSGMIQEVAVYPDAILSAATAKEHYEAFLADHYHQAVVYIRDPFPPHSVLAQLEPASLGYATMLMQGGLASFAVPTDDPNLTSFAALLVAGMAISIERDDGLYPWFGWITTLEGESGGGFVTVLAEDHVGALLTKAISPLRDVARTAAAADHITRAFRVANRRAHPPLMLELDLVEGGVPVRYEMNGEYLDDLLQKMSEATDWEWRLRYELSPAAAVTSLEWRGRIGRDLRGQVSWEEGIHFVAATYHQDARAFISSSVAVGGTGTFRSRTTAERGGASKAGDRTLPPLLGTVLVVLPQVQNEEALTAAAGRVLDAPEHVEEQVSFTLAEREIDPAYAPGAGDVVTVRFADILSGMTIQRVVRILGVQHDPEAGEIDIEAKVEREEPVGAIT